MTDILVIRMRRSLACFSILVALIAASARAATADDPGLAAVQRLLAKSGGELTPQVRTAYLEWAQKRVTDELAAKKQSIPADCLDEVRADPTLRDAMFASVFPPDPDILRNYATLRTALGPEFMRRYKELVIGAAVGQRNSSAVADESDFAPAASQPSEIDDSPDPTEALSKAVADFLKSRNLAALDAYKDSAHRDELRAYLQNKHFDRKQVDPLRKDKPLARVLKQAMILLGQRPATRESRPDEATWLKHLAEVYESHPDSTPAKKKKGRKPMDWPLFPMDRAPWPLLMPLSRPLPLGEARYIWEKFNGEHGPDRFHSYGPYRKFDAEILYELQPSPYHWDSWMDRIVHGGVCTTMCTITIDLHSALCIPSVHAGQPHHANLITYRDNDGKWDAEIQQAFAGGPDVTKAGWFFRDEPVALRMKGKTVGSEYHLGLAQGMNIGVREYVDTRIAVNLFNAMAAADQKTIGAALLSQAIRENPFNPAPWYLLAAQTTDAADGISIAQRAQRHTAGDEKHADAEVKYWRTLTEFLTREAVLRHPMPKDEAAARRVYLFLKTGVHGLTDEEQVPYFHRFEGKTASSS